MPWKNQPTLWPAVIALIMTALGAVANYSFKILSGELFRWRTLCLQIIVALFAGSLMMLLSIHYGLTDEFTGGACGMAGWCGASLIKTLEKRFLSRAEGANENQRNRSGINQTF